MTSNSISLKNNLAASWNALNPGWRWAVGVFVVARVFYTFWSLGILLLVPFVLQNLNLFGTPVVSAFDLSTSERFIYARTVSGAVLTFTKGEDLGIADTRTGSVWDLRTGRAVSGAFAGTTLAPSVYEAEDLFPYRGVAPSPAPLLTLWQRFDTNWFLKIAQRGYAADDGSTVYMPLYPLLIRLVGMFLPGGDLLAALLISNLAWVIALYLTFRYTQELFDAETARRALIYLAVFPTAFFFLAAYTESLFLALAVGALYAGHKNNFLLAGALGALAALTRLQGVLLVVPLAYMAGVFSGASGFRLTRQSRRSLVPLGLIPLATLGFLVYSNLSLFASYEGELHARFVLPWENLWAGVTLILEGRASIPDLANVVVTLLFGAMCVVVWRTMPRALALYTVLMFVAPLLRMTTTQPLVSMARYVLILFPVFMLWGRWGANGWVNRAIIYPSFLLSLYFSAQFWMWGWVA